MTRSLLRALDPTCSGGLADRAAPHRRRDHLRGDRAHHNLRLRSNPSAVIPCSMLQMT